MFFGKWFERRANDTASECNFLLHAVCNPAYNTCCCEQWCKHFLWYAQHTIDKTRIHIDICTHDLSVRAVYLCKCSRCQFFDQFNQIEFVAEALLFCERACGGFEGNGAGIAQSIDSMPHAVDETGTVSNFFVQYSDEVAVYFFGIVQLDIFCLMWSNICTTLRFAPPCRGPFREPTAAEMAE